MRFRPSTIACLNMIDNLFQHPDYSMGDSSGVVCTINFGWYQVTGHSNYITKILLEIHYIMLLTLSNIAIY